MSTIQIGHGLIYVLDRLISEYIILHNISVEFVHIATEAHMFDKLMKAIPVISLIILISILLGCTHEYPPFDEYEAVGFVPVDSVKYGMLYMNNGRLFALYDTTSYYNRWSFLREYDLHDPPVPVLENSSSLFLPPSLGYRCSQDSFVFFEESYYDLLILNLNTLETHDLYLGYHAQDVAHREHFLFISTYDGLRVLDISNLPEYLEVFNDSVGRSGAFFALRDTILIDIYQSTGHYRAKFWNIKNAENPQLIYEEELPGIENLRDVALTDQYIILFDHYTIYRYNHCMYDSLVYEDMLYLNQGYSSQKTTDFDIILAYGNYFELIEITDFSTQQITVSGDWYYQILSLETFEGMIYLLIRKQGIYVLQWRES
jgi:hypothetical protein